MDKDEALAVVDAVLGEGLNDFTRKQLGRLRNWMANWGGSRLVTPNPAESLELLPTRAKVRLAGDIEATVCAATIRESVVSYQVVWWDGRNHHEEWVWAWEVTPISADQSRVRVGFNVLPTPTTPRRPPSKSDG